MPPPLVQSLRLAGRRRQSAYRADASRCGGFAVSRLPTPGARTVAPLCHALVVDLRDDLAIASEQRLGRAHLGAQRQFAVGQTVGAVFLILGGAAVRFRTAGAIGAFVHLAARAEIADPRVLWRAERAGVEAVTATDADVLGMQYYPVRRRVERINGTYRLARRIGAVHAGHRHRALARLAVIDRDDS